MPRIPGLLEHIQQPLYDTLVILPGVREYVFFQETFTREPLQRLYAREANQSKKGMICPLCRDILGNALVSEQQSCPSCNTAYHGKCLIEMGGCSTLGCDKKDNTNLYSTINHNEIKTLTETNMLQGGSLPYPQNFEIHSFGLSFESSADPDDVEMFKEYSNFRFFLYKKDYLILPTSILYHHCSASRYKEYIIAQPIDLIPQQNFGAVLTYTGKGSIKSAFRTKCWLSGFFKREVH